MEQKDKDYILKSFGPQCGGYPICRNIKGKIDKDGEQCKSYYDCGTRTIHWMIDRIEDLEKKLEEKNKESKGDKYEKNNNSKS